jgi:putative glutamine amidotransferase
MILALTLEDDTVGADYFRSLEAAGFSAGEIRVLRSHDRAPADFDGLLLAGGEDVDPALYGEERREGLKRVNRRRDEQELALVQRARAIDVPIFGICRGLQVLNVAYGGTLIQDIPTEVPSAVTHEISKPRDASAHRVAPVPGRFLASEGGEFPVNSRHHQAIARLGASLASAACSPDGLIEAVEAEADGARAPIFAVQWHPENLQSDPRALRLFGSFYESVSRLSRERKGRTQ